MQNITNLALGLLVKGRLGIKGVDPSRYLFY